MSVCIYNIFCDLKHYLYHISQHTHSQTGTVREKERERDRDQLIPVQRHTE